MLETQIGGFDEEARGRLAPRRALIFAICVLVLTICAVVGGGHSFWIPLVHWFLVGAAIGSVCHELVLLSLKPESVGRI